MKENKKEFSIKKELFDWIKSIGWAFIFAIIINMFIFNMTTVKGSSMADTLEENDKLFAQKVSLYFKDPKVGDIVILKSPTNDIKENIYNIIDSEKIDTILKNDFLKDFIIKDYVKRVIAVEGDRVSIVDGKVYVNNKEIYENYIDENSYTDIYNKNQWEVGKNEVFVLGDNREFGASEDSRSFGTISIDKIKSIANFRIYPLNERFGKIK